MEALAQLRVPGPRHGVVVLVFGDARPPVQSGRNLGAIRIPHHLIFEILLGVLRASLPVGQPGRLPVRVAGARTVLKALLRSRETCRSPDRNSSPADTCSPPRAAPAQTTGSPAPPAACAPGSAPLRSRCFRCAQFPQADTAAAHWPRRRLAPAPAASRPSAASLVCRNAAANATSTLTQLRRRSRALKLAVCLCRIGPAPCLRQQIGPRLFVVIAAFESRARRRQLRRRLRRLGAGRHGEVQMPQDLHPLLGMLGMQIALAQRQFHRSPDRLPVRLQVRNRLLLVALCGQSALP